MIQSNVTHSYIKVKNFKNRNLMYVYHMLYFVNYVIISVIKNYNLMNYSIIRRASLIFKLLYK